MRVVEVVTQGPIGPQGPAGPVATGSLSLSNVLTLIPQNPLPLGVATGSFAVSSSIPPKPYFFDGTSWNALY
jgi:hypothetical protein